MNTFGVVYHGIHTDVSKTERGAKCYATRNGYCNVSIRYNCGHVVEVIWRKENNKWIKQ